MGAMCAGLGTFRGRNAGVWPPLKAMQMDFSAMSSPDWFDSDPRLADFGDWGWNMMKCWVETVETTNGRIDLLQNVKRRHHERKSPKELWVSGLLGHSGAFVIKHTLLVPLTWATVCLQSGETAWSTLALAAIPRISLSLSLSLYTGVS